jgi:Transcriptional regulator containing an amidase domain and an AraC-type DNA-binding HTH domain
MVTGAAPKVVLSRTVHPPRQSLPVHEHRNAYLSIVIEGDYLEQVGKRAVHCRPLQIRFHPPGEVHENHFGVRGGHVLNFELDEIWNAELDTLGLADPNGDLLLHDGAELAFQAWRNRRQPLLVEESVARLLHRARDAGRETRSQGAHAGIRKAIVYLHDSEGRAFSLFDVASAAGLHATHLARIFRARIGCTVGAYARRIRLERALRHMHAHPEWSLSRVAVEAGFSDHPHLTREYQRFVGAAPSRLRRDMASLRGTFAAR